MRLYFDQFPSLFFGKHHVAVYDTENDNAYAGMVRFSADPVRAKHIGEISDLEVSPPYRGKGGAATPLMRHAEAELTRLGFQDAALSVTESNKHAQEFYERMGWRRIGQIRVPFTNNAPVLLYRKYLAQEHG